MNLRPANLLFNYVSAVQFDLHKALMRHKLKKLSHTIIGDWLDIGAGDVPYKAFFAKADKYVTTNTKSHYNDTQITDLEPITDFWIVDGKQLPFGKNAFDGVVSFQVLSVIENPNDFFAEINRVLKPGGTLLLSTDFLYPVWSREDIGRHSATGLKRLCAANGLEVLAVESFGGFCSAVYAQTMRYLRSYPEIWITKKIVKKLIYGVLYGISLILLPIFSLCGIIVYATERHVTNNSAYTFNLMLIARKVDKH